MNVIEVKGKKHVGDLNVEKSSLSISKNTDILRW